jgi:hypothetical protein
MSEGPLAVPYVRAGKFPGYCNLYAGAYLKMLLFRTKGYYYFDA